MFPAFQLELLSSGESEAHDNEINLKINLYENHNFTWETLYLYIRPSCEDPSVGTLLGILSRNITRHEYEQMHQERFNAALYIFVNDLVQTIDERNGHSQYPEDFPIEQLSRQAAFYDHVFCEQVCNGIMG